MADFKVRTVNNWVLVNDPKDSSETDSLRKPALVDSSNEEAATSLAIFHEACLKNDIDSVSTLIHLYEADVNAEDRTQPILVAGLLGYHEIVKIMAEEGADVDAEFGKDIYSKYVTKKKWRTDFGDKMTLLTYAILHYNYKLALILIEHNANLKIRDKKNRTLLMYALYNNCYMIAEEIISKVNDQEYINARDDDGTPTIYYLVHPKKYGKCRFSGRELLTDDCLKGDILKSLIDAGADVYATKKGYSSTALINMASYRAAHSMLEHLLPLYTSIDNSRALQRIKLHGDESFTGVLFMDKSFLRNNMKIKMVTSFKLIVKDIINRLAFGLLVPGDESKTLHSLISQGEALTLEHTYRYEQRFIQGVLKNEVIHYGNKSISQYEFISQCVNPKKLRRLVKNEALMDAFTKTDLYSSSEDYEWFKVQLTVRIMNARKRPELLEELKKVSQLRKAIPLPYELVLEIIEYFSNPDLETFINAFVTF